MLVTDEIRVSLAETIAWCTRIPKPWNPKTSFRSLDLAYAELDITSRVEMVNKVIEARRFFLNDRSITPAQSLAGGRLLVTYPNINMRNGMEETESNGFVNYANVPGWDTWIAFFEESGTRQHYYSFLLSWVPTEFLEIVDVATDMSPEESINWIDRVDHPINHELERCGLAYQP